jgi:hypothetical protein
MLPLLLLYTLPQSWFKIVPTGKVYINVKLIKPVAAPTTNNTPHTTPPTSSRNDDQYNDDDDSAVHDFMKSRRSSNDK